MDSKELFINELPLKGYRDVQICSTEHESLVAFLPKRNLVHQLGTSNYLELDKAQKFKLVKRLRVYIIN